MLTIVLCVIGLCILVSIIPLYDWYYYSYKPNKSKKDNEEYYNFAWEVRKMEHILREQENYIEDIKTDINKILEGMKYLPQNNRDQALESLETMRNKLNDFMVNEYDPFITQYRLMEERRKAWKRAIEKDGEMVYDVCMIGE